MVAAAVCLLALAQFDHASLAGKNVAFVANDEVRAGVLRGLADKAKGFEEFKSGLVKAKFEYMQDGDLGIVIDDMCAFLRSARVNSFAIEAILDGSRIRPGGTFNLNSLSPERAWAIANEIRQPDQQLLSASGAFGISIYAKLTNSKFPGKTMPLSFPRTCEDHDLVANPVKLSKRAEDSLRTSPRATLGTLVSGWLAGEKYTAPECSLKATTAYAKLAADWNSRRAALKQKLMAAVAATMADPDKNASPEDMVADLSRRLEIDGDLGAAQALALLTSDRDGMAVSFDVVISASEVVDGVPSSGPNGTVIFGIRAATWSVSLSKKP